MITPTSRLGSSPLFDQLNRSQRILLAGAGGGCDIYCTLPFFSALRSQGKDVFLANLSFTTLSLTNAAKHSETLFEVVPDSNVAGPRYFPEQVLARWLHAQSQPSTIYAFQRAGVAQTVEDYAYLAKHLNLDAIVLVDGGTDALMCGDEFSLGTPHEDVTSILAASLTNVPFKSLVCTAFGVDAYHDICHAHFLRAVADLITKDASLGVFSLERQNPDVHFYLEAVEDLTAHMPGLESIVNTSLSSGIRGAFGDVHSTARTRGSTLFINPLMSLCWCFLLDPVAARIQYRDKVINTRSRWELAQAIADFRETHPEILEYQAIPV